MSRFDDYPNLRAALDSEFANLPGPQLRSTLARHQVDAEAMEGWLSSLGSIAKVALPALGGIVGTAFGGPVGATLGSSLGRLAGGAIGGLTGGGGAPTPAPPSPSLGMAPQLGASPVAGQLLQTIARPETMQALLSMFLGPQLGRPSVQVGSTPVPVGAFGNLLGVLANQAASESNMGAFPARGMAPGYMLDFAGETRGDPTVAQDRAAALYELLERESPEWHGGWRGVPESESTESEYDAMDMAEIAEFAEFGEDF